MNSRPTHRAKPSPAKPAFPWRSWYQAQFFLPVLLQRTSSTLPSAPHKEIGPGTQVRGSSSRWKKMRERGDTLVEVLIAISVVSLILGGAYITTNRSLIATRAAEERGNALKLAESQLEQLKGFAKSDPDAIFGAGTPSPFCIAGQPANIVIASSAECKVDAAGQPTGTEPIYTLSIARGSDSNTFTVTNQWTDASGRIADNLQLIYRVYE